MSKDPNTSESASWMSPFEAGRQWLELATKAQNVFLDQMKRDAAPEPFAQHDVTEAFSQMVSNLMKDPAKLAKGHAELWQSHVAFWQDLLTKNSRPDEKHASHEHARASGRGRGGACHDRPVRDGHDPIVANLARCDRLVGRSEIVAVAGGWSFRTRLGFGEAIRAALGGPTKSELSKPNAVVLMGIAYFQPITRGELSQLLGREVSRDAIAALREEDLIAAGPRSPTPGAPYAYVTTPGFLGEFGFDSLRDLPDIEKLADAGLLGRTGAANIAGDDLAAELRGVLGLAAEEDAPDEDAA
jgi:chromosome segregation and condensation protein ScpB